MPEYLPIACAEHERLEFAVLRRQRLQLRYRGEDGEERDGVVLPTDVQTRERAEWLTFIGADGAAGVVRLDRIISARPA